jgi:uncharacterized membrane protein YphA (DoxX/SURF4 family)
MRLPVKAREIPGRLATGAFILHSGLEKRKADAERAAGLHGFAKGTYPFLGSQQPEAFVRRLSTGEIALGALLLAPVVPTVVAGAALTGFSAGLLGMYLKTPGMRKPGSIWPSPQGLTISKDVWMLGIGVGLLVDAWSRKTAGRKD